MYIYIYKLYLKIFLEKISLSCISIIKFKRKTLMDLIETKVQNSIIFFIKTNFVHLDNALILSHAWRTKIGDDTHSRRGGVEHGSSNSHRELTALPCHSVRAFFANMHTQQGCACGCVKVGGTLFPGSSPVEVAWPLPPCSHKGNFTPRLNFSPPSSKLFCFRVEEPCLFEISSNSIRLAISWIRFGTRGV